MKRFFDDRLPGEDDVWVRWRFNNGTLVEGWRTHADWFALAGYGSHDQQVTMRHRMIDDLLSALDAPPARIPPMWEGDRADVELLVNDLIEKGWHRW